MKNKLPVAGTMSTTKPNDEPERRYKAEDALRDIERAEKHRKDKGLMKDVKKMAREKIKTMKDIC